MLQVQNHRLFKSRPGLKIGNLTTLSKINAPMVGDMYTLLQ